MEENNIVLFQKRSQYKILLNPSLEYFNKILKKCNKENCDCCKTIKNETGILIKIFK